MVAPRFRVGGGLADYVVGLTIIGGAKLVKVQPDATVTFWTAATGGQQHTDLLDQDGTTPLTSRQADSVGNIAWLYLPPGVIGAWASADGGPRLWMDAWTVDMVGQPGGLAVLDGSGLLPVAAIPPDQAAPAAKEGSVGGARWSDAAGTYIGPGGVPGRPSGFWRIEFDDVKSDDNAVAPGTHDPVDHGALPRDSWLGKA